jgi:hypothetical protein
MRTFSYVSIALAAIFNMVGSAQAGNVSAVTLYGLYKGGDEFKSPLDVTFFMTDDEHEAKNAVQTYGFYWDGERNPTPGFPSPGLGNHCSQAFAPNEGPAGSMVPLHCMAWVFAQPVQGTVPVYRYLNPETGKHFFTTSHEEGQQAVYRYGFADEGICCYVAPTQLPGTVPLYRLYSDKGGHFYTTDSRLEQWLELRENFRSEGITGYVWATSVNLPSQ